MAGLFFCLAPAEGAGLLFFPGGVSATRKRLQLLFCPTPKASTGLYSSVSVNLTHSSAHNTANTQAAYTPPAPRWRAYHQTLHLHQYQIQPPRWTLHSSAQTAYYNKVCKAQPCYGSMPDGAAYCRPCQPGGVSSCRLRIAGKCWHAVSSTDPAHLLMGQRLHLYKVSPAACNLAPVSGQGAPAGTLHPAEQPSGRGAAAARNHWRLSPHLFSGFRPIANRGQQ